MRVLFFLLIICALGGYYQSNSKSSVIDTHDLREIKKRAAIQASNEYCPMNFMEASIDSLGDIIFDEALKYGYEADELNEDATLDVIDAASAELYANLESKCAHSARMSDMAPVGQQYVPRRAKSQEERDAEQAERDKKFEKVLGVVNGATDSFIKND